MARTLLITSKVPNRTEDHDGGSILVRQLTRYLVRREEVDALWLRAEPPARPPRGVRTLGHVPPLCAADRFAGRLASYPQVMAILSSIAASYERILITHVSNAFGIERLQPEVASRTILFPMFTSESYRLAGETVPDHYREMERRALLACSTIVSPSRSEVSQLVTCYGVDRRAIVQIPRGIDLRIFGFMPRQPSGDAVDILCIGSVKPQKNQLALVPLVRALADRGVLARVHLVGGASDAGYLRLFLEAARSAGLAGAFVRHGVRDHAGVAAIARRCQIAVSLAAWETFGRGIFEGMATGLPTFVAAHLDCVWEVVAGGAGAIAALGSPNSVAESMVALLRDPRLYAVHAEGARAIARTLDERHLAAAMVDAALRPPTRSDGAAWDRG